MAPRNLQSTVGTGYNSSGITGEKSSFAFDERIYAYNRWDQLSGNELFKIVWQRKVSGTWKTEVTSTWQNTGFSDAYQWAWIKDYPAGEWRINCYCGSYGPQGVSFTIKSAPAPPSYTPKTISRGAYSFTANTAEQEKQLKEFLGIDPAGDTLDTWLSKRDLAGLDQWKNYWADIFVSLGRNDLFTFIAQKYIEYKDRLAVPVPPELTWWQKLLAKIILANPIFKVITSSYFQSDFKDLTGVELTEANWVNWTDYILDYITPINVFNKLIYGENLAGEAEEFGTASDYLDLAMLFVIAIPGGAVEKIGVKVAEKTGLEGLSILAGRLAEKKIAPEVVEQLMAKGAIDAVLTEARKFPIKFAALIPKLSLEFKAILLAGLKKQADPTAYKLATAALETVAKSEGLTAIQKVLGVLPGATTGKKLFIAFTSLVGAAAGYVTLAQFLAWTGKEAIKEAISFSGLYLAIDNGNWELANSNLPALRDAIDAYKKATALARIIPFIGDIWEKAIEEAEIEYNNYAILIAEHLEEIELGKGTLKVTANVSGPDVYINGIKKGIAPLTISLDSGQHHVLVSKFQYTNYEEDVVIEKDTTSEVHAVINPIAAPGTGKGTLKLVVEPNDAVISIAGHPEIKKMGSFELDPGTYTIKASIANYYEKTATAIISDGEVSNVSIILTAIPAAPLEKTGILSIRVIPEDAVIEVAGVSSISESGDYEIPPGTYTIKAGSEGFYDKYATAYIKANETFVVSLQLAEVPSTPTTPIPGEVPTEEVIVPMDPYKKTYNAWKYTINAVAKDTGEILHAAIFIDGAALGKYTPWSIYLYPEARYILRLEKWGYTPAEVELNTPAIPE